MNICLCGQEAGFPHSKTCPFPYYCNYAKAIEAWEKAELANQELEDYITLAKEGQEQDEAKAAEE